MAHRAKLLLSCGMLLCLLGCQWCSRMSGPNWCSPGPAYLQREQAKRFDPYPDRDLGPDVRDIRPPDFQRQMAEPTRSRWTLGGATAPAAPAFVPQP